MPGSAPPRRDGHWFSIDNAFLRDGWAALVGPHAIAVYVALALHADADTRVCWPSYQTLADLTGMSRYQAIRCVRLLERHRFIRVARRRKCGANLVTLLPPGQWFMEPESPGSPPAPPGGVVNPGDSCSAQSQPRRPVSHHRRLVGVTHVDPNKTHEQDLNNKHDDSFTHLWDRTLARLKLRMMRGTFETYLSYTRAVGLEGRTLAVAVGNPQTREWLDVRMRPLILSVLHETAGRELEVEFCLA